MLFRSYELTEELTILYASEISELAEQFSDQTLCNKVASLADISQALNTLNKSR
jgi:hypothetical protein